MAYVRRILAALSAAVLLGGLAASPAAAGSRHPGDGLVLKMMSFNIFYGGDDLDLSTGDFCATPDGCPQTLNVIAQAIRKSGADIVGVQEAERNTSVLAKKLGWYGSDRAHVMSRWPLVDPPGSDGLYVFVEPSPGRVVAVANVHLPSDPYGPYLVRDGGTLPQVLDLERTTRLPALQQQLTVLPALARRGIPVMLTGDFNSPSYLDWTPAVAKVRPEVKYPVRWPVSYALARAGFHDSYREAHPDPVKTPGFTWTPGSPEADPHEVFDRIDWVLHAGPVQTLASTVVGEPGDPDAGVTIAPFPTDHRGVVSTLRVRPGPSPVLVAPTSRRVTIGDRLPVTFHAPGRRGERVALLDGHGRVVASAPTAGRRDGTVVLPTRSSRTGENTVALLSGTGRTLSTDSFWAYPAGTPTTVTTEKPAYRAGEPITVRWANAPGMALDWISVFACPAGKPCDDTSNYLDYIYTGTRIAGRATIGPDAIGAADNWPLAPGRYVVRLLPDDGYRSVAQSAQFTVG
jgi:endonuclease/exonuclease/phosphatase family metal-dependent hydrolase